MDAQTMLDYMGIIMDTEKLQNRSFTINLKLTDGDDYLLKIHHGVLLYYKDALSDEADLTISTPRIGILAITSGNQENIDKLITVEDSSIAMQSRITVIFFIFFPPYNDFSYGSSIL